MSNSTKNTPATVVNSDYKWLTQSLKTAQLGPAYTPYFKMKALDDSLSPNQIVYGQLLNGLVSAYNLDGNSNDSVGGNNGTDTGIQYVAGKIGQAAQFSGISTSGLVSYYKLDANSNDSVGSNNGTDTAISYANPGIIGNCATFNGSSSNIDLGTSSNLNFTTSDFSFSFWIKPTVYAASYIYSKGAYQLSGYYIFMEANGAIELDTNQSGAIQVTQSNTAPPLNQWTHVVITRQGSTGRIFFNGIEVSYSSQQSIINPTTTALHAYLGEDSGAFFTGSLDEIGIWSRALSTSEISSLYNSGAARALQYFGSNITIGTSSSLNLSVFTIAGWINTSVVTTQGIICFRGTQTPYFRCSGTGTTLQLLSDDITIIGTSTGTLPVSGWTHVAVSYDALGNYTFYINGISAGSGTNLVAFNFAGTGGIGFDSNANADYFNGLIDMLYIYNRALTAGEVANLYNAGSGSIPFTYPLKGDATTAPDNAILMAGGDGSGNLRFWKLNNAGITIPIGTILVSSGSGYISTLNTSIAVSNWIKGSYVIDVYFWRTVSGNSVPGHARSIDGGNTWTINPYNLPTISTPVSTGNFYIAAGQPIYNPTSNLVMATMFYIRNGIGASSAFYEICYMQWSGGPAFGAETAWSNVASSRDWTIHSLDVQYLNGSYYIFFAGFHNWYETPSGNNNYSIYLARLDNITSNSTTDSWQLTKEVFISTSPQSTNNNAFTFPKISTDGTLYYLVFNAVVGEGLTTASTGTNQIGTISNKYYYMMQSADLTNFTYPVPIYFTDGTAYSDTAGVTLVNQGSFYYLLGNGQNWQYQRNNTIADISNWVISYQIQEVSGSSSQITFILGNANNYWLGSSPAGVGASAIAINKKILLEQGYVTSAGNEVVPRNIFYIDTITLDSTAPNNTATIVGRDINRNLQIISTKFSFSRLGPSYYNDLFDGTTFQNWSVQSGNWKESNGFLEVDGGQGVIAQNNINNSQESSIIFTEFITPLANGDYVFISPIFEDLQNYIIVAVKNNGFTTLDTTITLFLSNAVVHTWGAYSIPFASGRIPLVIRKHNYHIFDIVIGTPNNSGVIYPQNVLDNVVGAPFYPLTVVTGIDVSQYFTSTAYIVNGSVALGNNAAAGSQLFQPFKYMESNDSFSLQEAMEYLCTIAGITNYNRRLSFSDSVYNLSDYFNTSFPIKNGMIVLNATGSLFNSKYTISNGEIEFTANVNPVVGGQDFGFHFYFRANVSGSVVQNAYYFSIGSFSGNINANLYINIGGNNYLLSSDSFGTAYSIPIDLTKNHTYKIVMIDQLFFLFIDGRCHVMWQDTNYTINLPASSTQGYWGMNALSNSILTIGNFVSYQLYNQITNVSFNPGDDMNSIVQNVLEIAYAYSYSDLFGRFVGLILNSTDSANYSYQNLLYELQAQLATQNTINEVIVTGNGVIATLKDPALIGVMGQVRSLSITDYTITTYQDALTRAQNELINANRLNQQNNPNHPMNVGSEVFDVVVVTNTGNNTTSVNGSFRVYNQTLSNNGSKGQYALQLEVGNL